MYKLKKLEDEGFSKKLLIRARLVIRMGEMAIRMREQGMVSEEKSDGTMVTAADKELTRLAISELLVEGSVWVNTEEDMSIWPELDRVCLTTENYQAHMNDPDVVYLDGIDFTDDFESGGSNWGISLGWRANGLPAGSILYVPEAKGGILCVMEPGRSLRLEQGGVIAKPLTIKPWNGTWHNVCTRPRVGFGDRLMIDSHFGSFRKMLRQKLVRPVPVMSCAYGLAQVACGNIHLYVHGLLAVHDWQSGIDGLRMFEQDRQEGDGVSWIFYKVQDGKLVMMRDPDTASFCPRDVNTGIMIGNSAVVEWFKDYLPHRWSSEDHQWPETLQQKAFFAAARG